MYNYLYKYFSYTLYVNLLLSVQGDTCSTIHELGDIGHQSATIFQPYLIIYRYTYIRQGAPRFILNPRSTTSENTSKCHHSHNLVNFPSNFNSESGLSPWIHIALFHASSKPTTIRTTSHTNINPNLHHSPKHVGPLVKLLLRITQSSIPLRQMKWAPYTSIPPSTFYTIIPLASYPLIKTFARLLQHHSWTRSFQLISSST